MRALNRLPPFVGYVRFVRELGPLPHRSAHLVNDRRGASAFHQRSLRMFDTPEEEAMRNPYLVATCAMATAAVSTICAQDAAVSYPTRPVIMVVLFAPGGGAEIEGRTFVAKRSENPGRQFIMDFKPGAAMDHRDDACGSCRARRLPILRPICQGRSLTYQQSDLSRSISFVIFSPPP